MPRTKNVTIFDKWKPTGSVATATLRLTDLAVVTYAVAPERIAPLVPSGFTPDRLPDENGDLRVFVQTTCAFVEEARWSVAPDGSGEAYREITYRVLGRTESGKPGAYLLRTFYSSDAVYLAQRTLSKNADFARVSVHVSGDPVRGTFDGYSLRTTADRGTTEWEIDAITEGDSTPAPFGTIADMIHFLLRREAVYFAPSVAPKGWHGLAPITLSSELPIATLGKFTSARLTPWREWGVLTAAEAAVPQSVLYFPALDVTALAPRPVKFS